MNLIGLVWANPFTSAVGAASAIAAILTALGVHIPGVDNGLLATSLIGLLGLFSKDAAVPAAPAK